MKVKTVALLAVAIGCGLFAMLGVRQAMNAKNAGNQEERVSVLVAATDIPVGTELTPEIVTFRPVALTLVPADAITTKEGYEKRSALLKLMPGDFITKTKLSEPGVIGKSVQIPSGMRVVSVKVNDTQTHSNMLAPGDRVDVLVTYQSRGQRGMSTKTRTLLEYVEIFATGNQTVAAGKKENEGQVKNISLLVTPEQANYVYLAERKGELSLVWRNMADDEQVQVGAVDERLMEELSGTLDKGSAYDIAAFDPETQEVQPVPDVSAFLSTPTPAEPAVSPAPVVVAQAEPARPTWKMTIFSGETAQTVELELPEDAAPAQSTGGTTTNGASVTGEAPGTQPVSVPVNAALESIMEQFKKLPFSK